MGTAQFCKLIQIRPEILKAGKIGRASARNVFAARKTLHHRSAWLIVHVGAEQGLNLPIEIAQKKECSQVNQTEVCPRHPSGGSMSFVGSLSQSAVELVVSVVDDEEIRLVSDEFAGNVIDGETVCCGHTQIDHFDHAIGEDKAQPVAEIRRERARIAVWKTYGG
jgi:hypothetical protein